MLSVEKAGDQLGVSRWTVYRMIDRGELHARKVRGRLKVAESDINDYLDGLWAS